MTRLDILAIVISIIVTTIFLIGLYWYRGRSNLLTQAEVDRYIATIEAQEQNPGGRHDIPALRNFLENDDGKPFYTVNLYRFYDEAQYLDDQPYEGTGVEAFERFSSTMIRLLAQRGSHPIFGSTWADDYDDGTWDRIVIVRYRSRRDIADLFASDEFADANMHKWAALAQNERMLVQGLHIPDLTIPAVMVMIILVEFIVLVVYFLKYRGAI